MTALLRQSSRPAAFRWHGPTAAARLTAARAAWARATKGLRWRQVTLLLALLPLFGESFAYVKQVPPLWALSKIFPIVSLPLAALLMRGRRPLCARQLLMSFVWLLLVPSFISLFTFQQTFFVALTSQVKLLPILSFFSLLACLRWLKPTARELATAFIVAALVTFVILLLLWALAPQSAYAQHYVAGDSPLLDRDARGNRIRLPMFFGLIGILYAWRRFLAHRRIGWFLLWALGFFLVFTLVKMRTYVFGLALVMALTTFLTASPKARLALTAAIPVAFLALFQSPFMASIFSTGKAYAFDVRYISTMKAVAFLGDNPLHWIFGVGSISPMDPAGMMTYFNHFFFLADITWVGILFEFGLIGAMLIAALPLRGIFVYRRLKAVSGDAMVAAWSDYLVYTLLISEMLPITLAPGEVTTLLAIGVYLLERRVDEEARRPAPIRARAWSPALAR